MKALLIILGLAIIAVSLLYVAPLEASSTCRITYGEKKYKALKSSIKLVLNDACKTVKDSYGINSGKRTMADVIRIKKQGLKPCVGSHCVHNRGIAADLVYARHSMKQACHKLWGRPYGVRCYCKKPRKDGSRRGHIHLDTTGVKKDMTRGRCGVGNAKTMIASAKKKADKVKSGQYKNELYARYKNSAPRAGAASQIDQFFQWHDANKKNTDFLAAVSRAGIKAVKTRTGSRAGAGADSRSYEGMTLMQRNEAVAREARRKAIGGDSNSFDRDSSIINRSSSSIFSLNSVPTPKTWQRNLNLSEVDGSDPFDYFNRRETGQ